MRPGVPLRVSWLFLLIAIAPVGDARHGVPLGDHSRIQIVQIRFQRVGLLLQSLIQIPKFVAAVLQDVYISSPSGLTLRSNRA